MSSEPSPRTLPRGPHGLSRQEVETSQRLRLLAAMVDAVASKGYANTSVADVLARSGISRATFYAQFKDKDDCFRAAFETAAAQVAAMMANGLRGLAAAGGGKLDSLALLDRALTIYLQSLASQPALARIFLVEVYAAGPEAIAQRQKSLDAFVDVLAGIFKNDADLFGGGDRRFAITVVVNAVSSLVTNLVGVGDYQRLPELKEPLLQLARDLLERKR